MTDHVDARHLFDAAQGIFRLTDEERAHIHECEDCSHLMTVFSRQRSNTPPKGPIKRNDDSAA